MALTGTVIATITGALTKALDLSTPSDSLSRSSSWTITSGTGANQADMSWHDIRTLGASTSESLDLAGSLENAFGDVQTFARIKAILIVAKSTNVGNVQVGGAASNQFYPFFADAGDIIVLRPGATMMLVAPDATAFPVTAGTADLLKIENMDSGNAAIYDIVLIGASA